MEAPPKDEAARIERALSAVPRAWREITRRGQTNASHWLVELADGSTAFVKSARSDDTASWIRDEHLFYAQMRGASFLPTMLGWHDDGERPVIVLEDCRTPTGRRRGIRATSTPSWRAWTRSPRRRHPPTCRA